jgi:hypothetical protein
VGTKLLEWLEERSKKPMLIGTWADAKWAIDFYKKNGYTLVSAEERGMLLEKYWTVSASQAEASVVLADSKWIRSG